MPGPLTLSPADVIANLLVQLGVASIPVTTSGASWGVYVSNEPTSPDRVITVYDTEGRKNGRTMTDGEIQEHHGVQIRIRSDTYPIGYTKARAVVIKLDRDGVAQPESACTTVTIGGVRYWIRNLSRTSDVISVGKEAPNSKRTLFTVNYLVSIRMLTD